MKTFTVRDLDRKPGAVLDVCDREGAVRIQRRDGRKYTVRSSGSVRSRASAKARRRWLDGHLAWVRQTFSAPVSAEQIQLVDRLLAGE